MNSGFVFFFIVNFLSVMWFVFRISRRKDVGILTLVCALCITMANPLPGIVTASSFVVIEFAILWWERVRRFKNRQQQLKDLIDRLILEMKMGKSFRSALSVALKANPSGEFQPPLGAVEYKTQDPWMLAVHQELVAIDKQQHQAIRRLELWRQRFRTERQFARRRHQMTAQVRLQALVLSLLYFALFTFTVWRSGFFAQLLWIIVSLALFLVGIALIFCLGKRVRWTF